MNKLLEEAFKVALAKAFALAAATALAQKLVEIAHEKYKAKTS